MCCRAESPHQGVPGRSFSPLAASGAPRAGPRCHVLPCPGHMGGVRVPTGVQHRCAGRCVCIHCPLLRRAGSSAGLSRAGLLGPDSHRPRAPAASSGADFALSTPLCSGVECDLSSLTTCYFLAPVPRSQALSSCPHATPSLPCHSFPSFSLSLVPLYPFPIICLGVYEQLSV